MTNERWRQLMENRYSIMKNANILDLLTKPKFEERKQALKTLTRVLNGLQVEWAFACSFSLFILGLTDGFNDFDVLIKPNDAEVVEKALIESGAKLEEDDTQKGGYFSSPFYREGFLHNGVHIDLIGDITVCTFRKKYVYRICPEEIQLVTIDGNINVPVCPVEANMVLYGMMEGWQSSRIHKRELCKDYLIGTGLMYPQVLDNALEQGLPPFLESIVKEVIQKQKNS